MKLRYADELLRAVVVQSFLEPLFDILDTYIYNKERLVAMTIPNRKVRSKSQIHPKRRHIVVKSDKWNSRNLRYNNPIALVAQWSIDDFDRMH